MPRVYLRDFRVINIVEVPWNTVESTTENAMSGNINYIAMINLNAKTPVNNQKCISPELRDIFLVRYE